MVRNSFLDFKKSIVALCAGACFFLFTGCGRKSLESISASPLSAFSVKVPHDELAVYGRLCGHEEIMRYFNRAEDFYHYYHLLQLRLVNSGYVRYTVHADDCSFYIPPASLLQPYTSYASNGGGLFFAFLNAVIFFPVYAISMLKSAVETTPYLAYPDLVVPQSFALLTVLYAGVILAPVILGALWEKSRSTQAFREAEACVLTQYQQFSCGPFSTIDVLIMTPKTGFTSPCSISLYNHKTHAMEKVVLAL